MPLTVLSQAPAEIALAPAAVGELELVPHALHVVQVPLGIALVPREHGDAIPRVGLPSRPQEQTGGQVVDVPVLVVEVPAGVDDVCCTSDVAPGLEEAGLELVEVHRRGGVVDAPVDEGQSLGTFRVILRLRVVTKSVHDAYKVSLEKVA